jgi:hypothetical protein
LPAPAARRSTIFPCIGRDETKKRFAFSIRYAAPAAHNYFIATFVFATGVTILKNIRAHHAGLHGLHECCGYELLHSVACSA